MNKITIRYNGGTLSYVPAPGTDLSKLDIVSDDVVENKTTAKIGRHAITYVRRPTNPDAKPTPHFKGGDDMPVSIKERSPYDVDIISEEPSEVFHSYNEGFWVDDDGVVKADDERYRFNTEYVQLCKRKFDCYAPNYTNKSGLQSATIMVDMSENTGIFDPTHGQVTDNSTDMELVKLSVMEIANYMYEGVPISTHRRDDAFHILTIVNDAMDKYIGAIPVAPSTFVAPEAWFEPLAYLRESILEARPGLIQRLATDYDHAGKPRKPRIGKISL